MAIFSTLISIQEKLNQVTKECRIMREKQDKLIKRKITTCTGKTTFLVCLSLFKNLNRILILQIKHCMSNLVCKIFPNHILVLVLLRNYFLSL